MEEEEVKRKYFEYLKSLKGKEFEVEYIPLKELLHIFTCKTCPIDECKNSVEWDCINWDLEFDEQYRVKIKIVDFRPVRGVDMIREVVVKQVEAVECRFYGLVTLKQCRACPYYGGMVGFKLIRCKRREMKV